MKHTFYAQDDDGYTVRIETDAVSIQDLLDAFKSYLQACTYTVEGEIEIVKPLE